jgi:hypothetical protein
MKVQTQVQALRKSVVKIALAGIALSAVSMVAQAQDWPKQSIKFVVPFTAGSGTDIVARAVAEKLTTALGQPVVIENKPGAGGTIAANQVAKKLRNIPYAWIGPANWDEDNGINKVFKSSADSGTFFLTKNLTLTRAGDGRHPDVQGYRVWMDSVANWLQTSAKYKMAMKPPRKRGRPFRSSIITLNAAKYRGY